MHLWILQYFFRLRYLLAILAHRDIATAVAAELAVLLLGFLDGDALDGAVAFLETVTVLGEVVGVGCWTGADEDLGGVLWLCCHSLFCRLCHDCAGKRKERNKGSHAHTCTQLPLVLYMIILR